MKRPSHDQRTEGLLVVDRASVDVREDGRFIEVTRKVNLFTSDDNLGTVLDGVLDVRVDLVNGSLVDQGSVGDALSGSLSDFEVADGFRELRSERVVDTFLDVDAVRAHAMPETLEVPISES